MSLQFLRITFLFITYVLVILHDLDDLHDHLRNVTWIPLKDNFKLVVSAVVLKFITESMLELVSILLIININHKYQVKPRSSYGFQLLLLLTQLREVTYS